MARLFCLALPLVADAARGIMTGAVDLSVPECCVPPPRIMAQSAVPRTVFCAPDDAQALTDILKDWPPARDRSPACVDVGHPAGLVSPQGHRPSVGMGVGVDIRPVSALRGRDYGDWSGQPLSALPAPALLALTRDTGFAPPGGESWRQFASRPLAWLHEAVPQGTQALLMVAPAVLVALVQGILAPRSENPPDLDIGAGAWCALTRHDRWRVRLL